MLPHVQRIWPRNDEQVWEKRKHKGGKSEAGATQSARQTPKEERPTNLKSVKGYSTKETKREKYKGQWWTSCKQNHHSQRKDTALDGSSDETREVESMEDKVYQETIWNKRKFRDDDSPMTPSAPKKERSNSKGEPKAPPP